MTIQVKICGLKTEAMLDAVLDAGADYVGLVLFRKSPRNVSNAEARRLANHARGRAKIVVLTVDPSDELVRTIAGDIGPDLIQLHGHETVQRVAEVMRSSGLLVLKAIGVATAADVAAARAYHAVTPRILFDAKPPAGHDASLPGGNGLAFDRRALSAWHGGWYMLAGGLTATNVAEAIRLTRAPAVDVSSGVESAPGEKDAGLIRAFVRAAKSA